MKESSSWLVALRVLVVLGIVGSNLLIPACGGSSGGGAIGGGGSGDPGTFPTNPIGPDPLSAIVAAFLEPGSGAADIPTLVKSLVAANPDGVTGPTSGSFPVPAATTDSIRVIPGLNHNVVVKWFDPLTFTVAGRVNLVNDGLGTAGNTTNTENVASSIFTITAMTGGSATAAATGRLQVPPGYQLVDGDFFTLLDGVNTQKFEFDTNGSVAAGANPIPFQASWNAHRMAFAVVDAINKCGTTLTISAYDEPIFGSHPDFLGFMGDGYNDPAYPITQSTTPGSVANPPQWNGNPNSAWLWSNHEYISTFEYPNFDPAVGLAPEGQGMVLAKWMRERGLIDFDPAIDSNWNQAAVDLYIRIHKRNVGGSIMHIVRDPGTGEWSVDKTANNRRLDASGTTKFALTGHALNALGHDDFGTPFTSGLIAGTAGNCSGCVSPWGTIISGEENVQDYYGDFEAMWDGSNQFVAGRGMDAGGPAAFVFSPSTTSQFGMISDVNGRQNRDTLGYVIEIDPLRPPNEAYSAAGTGHRKMGSFGRARWENACFAVDLNWKLVANQPLVMYGGDDRRGGRFFKWVSASNVTPAMVADMVGQKAALRALMDTGKLYVAHFQGIENRNGWSKDGTTNKFTFAAKGTGIWIELSTDPGNTSVAPNAALLGAGTLVKDALANPSWNNMAGLTTNDAVRRSVYTAANKIGIFEMNRPEEFAYLPAPPPASLIGANPLVIFSLTNFGGRPPALGKQGAMGEVDLINDANNVGNVPIVNTVTNFIVKGMTGATAGTPATGTIVCVRGDQITDGQKVEISDGTTLFTFEFDKDGTLSLPAPVNPRAAVAITNTDTAQGVAAKLITAIQAAAAFTVTAFGPTNDTAGRRTDTSGRIWALDDGTTPGTIAPFSFFEVFTGTPGTGLFDCSAPDNIAITKGGDIFFGTDGNFGVNGRADAVYYLDPSKVHPVTPASLGRAYRILACPADAEHTGPAFSADMKTLFNSIQHPGETIQSNWPNGQP